MDSLTLNPAKATINPLLPHVTDGSRRPNVGHKRPPSNVVFLYPSKTQVLLYLVLFVLVGCILEPFKRFAPAYGGTSNLIQSTAQQLDVVSGGYLLHIGDHNHVTK